MVSKPTLAMSVDFLAAFAKLPRQQQRSVQKMIGKFKDNPGSSGLNFERIQGSKEPNMRSIRIDQKYRAIVLKPNQGNVHMLLWADKHDDAYSWATRHHCSINPETGGIQIYQPKTFDETTDFSNLKASLFVAEHSKAFDKLEDRQLLRLGVPSSMLAEVRTVQTDSDLDAMEKRLPVYVHERLFYYMEGESYQNLISENGKPFEPSEVLANRPIGCVMDRETAEGLEKESEQIDTEDFLTALNRVDSRSRFVVVDDEFELQSMLNAPLEHWRVFLHPTQRNLVERDWNGPVRVLGAAGTGKTVVAMHRARWLAKNPRQAGRILFTTFTRNLAADIENNLRQICLSGEMDQIEVINFDRWVYGYLRSQGYQQEIVFGRHEEAWRSALDMKPSDVDLPDKFYEEEWEQVIQTNSISTKDEYRRVSRVGRGTRLLRNDRDKVWTVFEQYRMELAKLDVTELQDAYMDATSILINDNSTQKYQSVIVDEAQDMTSQSFRLIRALVPEGKNDIFITGDAHQRIYRRSKLVLGHCGINIVGRSRKLRLNYRTTEETRRWAADMLANCDIDDLDGGKDDNLKIRSLTYGPEPYIRNFETIEEQANYIVEYVNRLMDSGQESRNICIIARTKDERDEIIELIEEMLPVYLLDQKLDDRAKDGVRIATMHRTKGLEFDNVVMASVNDDIVPLESVLENAADESSRQSVEIQERALLYVAATRAKKELQVLSYGCQSRFLKS